MPQRNCYYQTEPGEQHELSLPKGQMLTNNRAFPGHHPGESSTRGKGWAGQLDPLSRAIQTFFEPGKVLSGRLEHSVRLTENPHWERWGHLLVNVSQPLPLQSVEILQGCIATVNKVPMSLNLEVEPMEFEPGNLASASSIVLEADYAHISLTHKLLS